MTAVPSERAAAITVASVSKKYRLFSSNLDRLKEALHPLGKTYHEEFWALRDISFRVDQGETVGLLGRNGAGKSTLLRIVAGLLPASGGSIETNGRVSVLFALQVGFNPEWTGRENVVMNARLSGQSDDEIEARMPEIIDFASIGDYFDRPIKIYSTGMVLRVAFAAALAVEPDILIIDEALAVGDVRFMVRCIERLKELKARGTTILLVTHAPELMVSLCDRGILLQGGTIQCDDDARTVADQYYALMFSKELPARRKTQGDDTTAEIVGTSEASRQVQDSALAASGLAFEEFVETPPEGDDCTRRSSYNPEEQRIETGRAIIVDYLILNDGLSDAIRLRRSTPIDVFFRARLLSPVDALVFGFGLIDGTGTKIYGSNSHLAPDYFRIEARDEDICCWFRIDGRLRGGDYFLDLGIVDQKDAHYDQLHTRRRLAHLVVEETPWFSGTADLGIPINSIETATTEDQSATPTGRL